jgi:nicotinamide phosphoribosyltransferase
MNFCLMADSYKLGHSTLYPSDLQALYAYFESRGGKYDKTVFFGLQYYLLEYLQGQVFDEGDVEYAAQFAKAHFGRDYFDEARWRQLYKDHGGCLPLRIKAVQEGSVIPTHQVLFTVESTDPNYTFLVTFVETLLMKVWYPITIATQALHIKEQLKELRHFHSDSEDGIDFMVHDFSYRGVTSEEQAAIGGAAHLTLFKGTDTIAGIDFLQNYYTTDLFYDLSEIMYGFSVPATEHSVILAFGEGNERESYEHLLKTYPTGIIACVSDTYDIYNAVDNLWGNALRDDVLNRDGVLVVRPDSGDPRTVVNELLYTLSQRFGYTINSKGKRLLNSHVRLIQGDGMNAETMIDLYQYVVKQGYAPENLTIGAGGGMMQSVNRDTQRFAYKVSNVVRGTREFGVAKRPVGDVTKRSKRGRHSLVKQHGFYYTVPEQAHNLLEPVFQNGEVLRVQSIEEIRAIIEKSLNTT